MSAVREISAKISTSRVSNGDGGVPPFPFPHQEEAQRFSHQHAAPDDHDVRAGCLDTAFNKEALAS